MCGIIGYKGTGKASSVLLSGLRNLEYRGYDSVGMASIAGKTIVMRKGVGKVEQVNRTLDFLSLPGDIGIAHTRWATCGKVTDDNAHPHLSNDGDIAIVHNGIIENYQELKVFLQSKGYFFKSETDTEVIPNLIQFGLSKGKKLIDAFRDALLMLEGSYAVLAIRRGVGQILFARKESPLVIGIGNGEFFLASDVSAFLTHTDKVIYLEDMEYGEVNERISIYDLRTGLERKKKPATVSWSPDSRDLGNYPHYMLKEIHEQEKTVLDAIRQDDEVIMKARNLIIAAKMVFIVGCGTSFHAGLSSVPLFIEAGLMPTVVLASEFRNYLYLVDKDSILIAISQSGETADLLDAVRCGREKGARIISIVNVIGSSLTRMSDVNIMMNSGPEICVLSTKTYTSQLAILLKMAYSISGKSPDGLLDAVSEIRRLCRDDDTLRIAERIVDSRDIFLIGRGKLYPTALEGALKIKEVTYIHAEGFPGGELKHGSIALIEKGVPVIVFVTKETRSAMISNANEIKSRGGLIIGIGGEENEVFDEFIRVRETSDANPISMIVPIQLLSYNLAVLRGCDPDKPRNLAKSVTVK